MATAVADEVEVSMANDGSEGVGEDMDEVEEDTAKEVMGEAESQMKMAFTSQMSPVTLKIKGGSLSQKKQEKYNRGPSMH